MLYKKITLKDRKGANVVCNVNLSDAGKEMYMVNIEDSITRDTFRHTHAHGFEMVDKVIESFIKANDGKLP